MKSCPCGADATLPFSMRHFGNGDVFFPPLVKGGAKGGWSVSNQAQFMRRFGHQTSMLHRIGFDHP
jgi:hypothetical protein